MELNLFDISVFLAFFCTVVGFSLFKSRKEETGKDFFLAGRSLTWPLIGFSLIAANISTEQFVGMNGQAAGTYEFIGGSGKWKGITGVGVTRGMLRGRTDDHFMLKSEMHWNISPGR